MPMIIRGKSVELNKKYESNIHVEMGIESKTAENIDPPFTLTHIVMPENLEYGGLI